MQLPLAPAAIVAAAGPCLRCRLSRGFLASTRRVGILHPCCPFPRHQRVSRSLLVGFLPVSLSAPPLVRATFVVVIVVPPRCSCRSPSPLPSLSVGGHPGGFCRMRRASMGSSLPLAPSPFVFWPRSWSSWSWLALPLSCSSLAVAAAAPTVAGVAAVVPAGSGGVLVVPSPGCSLLLLSPSLVLHPLRHRPLPLFSSFSPS
jgi:hypothetical protein